VVFVSHDRYFIDRLATRVFEIEGGELHDYPGNYEDYLWQKEGNALRTNEPEAEPAPMLSAYGNDNGHPIDADAQPKKLNPILARRMQDRGEELEEEITRAEAEITSCEMELANFKNAEESIRLSKRIDELRNGISAMTSEWEEIELALNESAAES